MNKNPTLTIPSQKQMVGTKPDDDHLDSWKAIANYLRREVRTVQLWEKNEALPVHRHFHKRLGSVFALRSELEAWKHRVSQRKTSLPAELADSSRRGCSQNCATILFEIADSDSLDSQAQAFLASIKSSVVKKLGTLSGNTLSIVGLEDATESGRASSIASGHSVSYALQFALETHNELQLQSTLVLLSTHEILWSRTHLVDNVNSADTLADRIAQCVWLKVSSSTAFASTSGPVRRITEKRGPREAYLKGRFFWNQRHKEGLRRAIQCFQEAIHEDPGFALPYSGLADALTLLSFYEIVSPLEVMPSARNAALRSIELNPNLAEAHASLGDVLLHFDRDWQGADREYRLAIQCNPEYALGYHWYSNLLAGRGEHDAAEVAIMQALEIDPVSIICLVWAGFTAHMAHRFDDAIKHYRGALELDPRFVWAHMYLGLALEQKGQLKEALTEFETAIVLAGGSDCVKAMKAHAHAMAGENQAARKILRELSTSSRKCTPSYDIAATYGALGEPEPMVAWLNRACRERSMKLFALPQDPRFDQFRNRADFAQVVAEVGITQHSAQGGA